MQTKGFTLIEMLVSVAIFAVVMTIALGALLSMSESDRKAQALKSVINNLNFGLDSISRSIRTGTNYHCGDSAVTNGSGQAGYTTTRDCTGTPANTFAYNDGNSTVVYRLETTDYAACGQLQSAVGCILRSTQGGGAGTFVPITAPEVIVNSLSFYVTGAESIGNSLLMQPKVTILIAGTVSGAGGANTAFNLQTSVTQRLYDQ